MISPENGRSYVFLFSVLFREFVLTGQMSYCATGFLHEKIIMLTLLILSVFSGYAESGTFNISQYNNTNDLIRDKQFQKHIKHFFGSLTGYYFWKGGVAQQVTDGLWGTPDSVVRPDKNIWMASACRPHSCTEKAAYITNGRYELFALIGYMCPSENGGVSINIMDVSVYFTMNEMQKKRCRHT